MKFKHVCPNKLKEWKKINYNCSRLLCFVDLNFPSLFSTYPKQRILFSIKQKDKHNSNYIRFINCVTPPFLYVFSIYPYFLSLYLSLSSTSDTKKIKVFFSGKQESKDNA